MTAREQVQIAAVLQQLKDAAAAVTLARQELREELGGIHSAIDGQSREVAGLKAVCQTRPATCAATFAKHANGDLGHPGRWSDPPGCDPTKLRDESDLRTVWRLARWMTDKLMAPVLAALLASAAVLLIR